MWPKYPKLKWNKRAWNFLLIETCIESSTVSMYVCARTGKALALCSLLKGGMCSILARGFIVSPSGMSLNWLWIRRNGPLIPLPIVGDVHCALWKMDFWLFDLFAYLFICCCYCDHSHLYRGGGRVGGGGCDSVAKYVECSGNTRFCKTDLLF